MISQVNERKRKLANGTEPNDIKPKYTKSSNVDLAEDDDNEENVNSDNNEDPSEPYEREDEFITSKPFSVKRLRDRLREGDFMQSTINDITLQFQIYIYIYDFRYSSFSS